MTSKTYGQIYIINPINGNAIDKNILRNGHEPSKAFILGGRWADKEHPCVDTYKNILNRYPDDDESYSIMVDFQHERISYPKQEGLWDDDDLVYVMDTHR